MDTSAARRSASLVGVGSGVIGVALVIAPERVNAWLSLNRNSALRVIGLADVLLAPGLISGEPRWRYVAGRAALNVAIAAFLLGARAQADDSRRPVAVSLALAAITVGDVRVASVLAGAGQ